MPFKLGDPKPPTSGKKKGYKSPETLLRSELKKQGINWTEKMIDWSKEGSDVCRRMVTEHLWGKPVEQSVVTHKYPDSIRLVLTE